MRGLVAGSGAALKGSMRRAVCPKRRFTSAAVIDVGHEALTRYLRTLVVAIRLPRRHRSLNGVQVLVRDSRQQMCDAIERACFLLSEFTTYHGLTLVSVWANIRSFACE
jgi:hypothetical protein